MIYKDLSVAFLTFILQCLKAVIIADEMLMLSHAVFCVLHIDMDAAMPRSANV